MAVYRQAYGSSRSAGSKRLAAIVLHSSHEPGELSQCFKHDDSWHHKDYLVLLLLFLQLLY